MTASPPRSSDGANGVPHVLIVDDSAVARQAIAKAIRAAGMEVAALAPNGRVGIEAVAATHPDAVVLDLEMPGIDGMGFLRAIRPAHPQLPIVVFSALTSQGAAESLAAMAAGASSFALKPTALRGSAPGTVEAELIPQLQALVECRGATPRATPSRMPGSHEVTSVVIGVSTGGPTTLSALVSQLPREVSVPIFVVQHMPPEFTRMLAQRLAAVGPLEVVEARHEDVARAGVVYIAPGGRHLTVQRRLGVTRTMVTDDPPENSCRPSVDVLFRSAAASYGNGVMGVVLTGMGRDGTEGSRAIVAAGGSVVVQEPATAVVGSMPQSVLDAGLAYAALPPDALAGEIRARLGLGRR